MTEFKYDPFICGQRLFIIQKPKFIKDLEAKEEVQKRHASVRESYKVAPERYGLPPL